MACLEVQRILDSYGTEYTYYDLYGGDERYQELKEIAEDDGYIHIPIGFINSECVGGGFSMLDPIYHYTMKQKDA